MATKRLASDYLSMPDDGKLHQLIEGELIQRRSETYTHQEVLGSLAFSLFDHVKQKQVGDIVAIGPLDVVLDESNVLQPDILFIDKHRTSIVRDNGIFGAPDLCIEVLSDVSRERDTVTKLAIYARCGVREYWIVDPDAKSATVYQLSIDATKPFAQLSEADWLTSVQLPDFKLSVRALFQR